MTDEELRKETNTLMLAAPLHWDRVAWQMDHQTLRRMHTFHVLGIDDRTRETTLFNLPIKIIHEPMPDRPLSDAELEADMNRSIYDFFVLTLICRGQKLGRTYYIDSEYCNDLVKSELKRD